MMRVDEGLMRVERLLSTFINLINFINPSIEVAQRKELAGSFERGSLFLVQQNYSMERSC